MPKVNRERAMRYERQGYPGKLRQRTKGCWKIMLSDDAGLTQFGAGEVELAPGAATSLMHWHVGEDEFVYVLEGEVVLVEQHGPEQVMRAGDSAGFRAGEANGHTFENRSSKPARLLEVGTRLPEETAYYTGLDMVFKRTGTTRRFETRAGQPIGPEDDVGTYKE